jgi:hypothetical protein
VSQNVGVTNGFSVGYEFIAGHILGSRMLDTSAIGSLLELSLGIELLMHESSYIGSYLRTRMGAPELIVIQNNIVGSIDGDLELMEPDYDAHITLIYVEASSIGRANEVADAISSLDGVEHLKGPT